MKLAAAAKINLMLDILGSSGDGFHRLFMIMQSVGLYDFIDIERKGEKGSLLLSCSEPSLPSGKKNTAFRAAELFFKKYGIENPGISIDISKHIPLGAGLAGGSADAAAVLFGLNELFGTGLSLDELCETGLEIGSDIPFCLKGGTAVALDTGGVIAPLPKIKGFLFVLAKPESSVSTKEAYDAFDRQEHVFHPDCCGMLHALVGKDCEKAFSLVANVFEQFIEVHERADIKAEMRRHGAIAHCMSGSGPTVYGIFRERDEKRARDCVLKLGEKFESVFLCEPSECGVKIID